MRGIVSECAALSVLAGLAVLSAGGPGPPEPRSRPAITVSPQTTYLTSPLNPDGTVNYVAAINAVYGRGVTPDNNAAIPMIRAFGPDVLKEETRREVFDRLQMPAAPQKGGYFQDLGSYLSARKAAGIAVQDDSLALSEKVDRAGKAFWTAEDHHFSPNGYRPMPGR
ncbi:MAG: hypothetical protein AMJ81_02500 [Phycisphaerae bacterium SM23_33]|nr:MAG: hypothetical protein AMJ81_02500 [Phycisphaerae bacterium SM23_33]